MNTGANTISRIVEQQRVYFASGHTRSVESRLAKLRLLRTTILKHEPDILAALHKDLSKSSQEGLITEIGLVIKEIDYHIKHLRKWSKARRVSTPIYLLPSSSYTRYEPMGVVLIIAPWNYPFQLLMTPLVGAVSAGNCVVLKPSEFCVHTNKVMNTITDEVFAKDHVAMVHGGKETNQALLAQKFDKIFFTGSSRLGKIVMQAAANTLTPVVLELGGKSPCVVDHSAKVNLAAKRIAWGKTVNLGQTCIAPDYLLVHESIKDELVEGIKYYWKSFFGEQPEESNYLARMITPEAFDRVANYLNQGKVLYGGNVNRASKFISPTLLEVAEADAPVMQEEIFGPILPVITYSQIQEAIDFINSRDKPLAAYYFGDSATNKQLLRETTSGGACLNDTLIHISNHSLPFGGVGISGMGHYHGKHSYETFSHVRSFMKSPTWIDLPFRYPPFRYFRWVRKLLT
ncbi:aldehyde dehydrogenase [Roseivirga thermotolerans]|uniref:aldehyde dehydrogenase n=1 Tax=Roseivirga thermotolerans TaxID=1758176 RepID=UPI00273EFCBE|nr:aldehyde dehydrogenase [Roseivirga thermotolerans]